MPPKPRRKASAPPPSSGEETLPADLTFRQAQAALELILSQLQADDLDIEAMVDLHRRAAAYADHCEHLLLQVEQEVMQWNPDEPDAAPSPYIP